MGPNGSGKSNLVDAISWVLGEQGPRALRGGQMADVIFAGSPQRSALGMAEVKLVIDNSAGLIPVPMTEIEISRTIFRSGESEYRIGGQVVRLLDVQELLSETGIGRALHTVVGQGQLEDVLTARPEDRRTYIEEAAGVAKHRKRKERAERKLAGLDQDVLRLQDVLAELKRQLKPLRQQAEMAKRHETLTAEADTVAVRLAAARLRDLWDERERRKEGWDEGVARRTSARERLDALDGRVAAAADERARSVWALQEAEAAFVEAQSAKSAAELELRRAVELESRGPAGGGRRRPTAARGCRRSRRTCDGSRPGSPRRRRSSRAERASSRPRRRRSRRPRTPGATPRTSAGASPRRRRHTAPRWRRTAVRSRRTIASVRGWRSRSGRSGSAGRPARRSARRSRPTSNASTRPRRRSAIAGPSSSASGTGSPTRSRSSRRGSAGSSCDATSCGRGSTTSSAPPAPASSRSTRVAASGSSAS